jgi:1-acyl-sn-glycerol-3-phosphate acyltransferase
VFVYVYVLLDQLIIWYTNNSTLLDMVVILKHDLKKIPIIGWCMQMTLYVFLQV